MPNMKIDLVGEDAGEALEKVQKIVQKYLGTDVAVTGVNTAESTLKTLSAVTLVLAIPTIFAHPQGFLQQLQSQHHQDAFIRFLLDLQRQYNIELTLTTPDGQRIDFDAITPNELRDILLRM
jgi:hypothetical protein